MRNPTSVALFARLAVVAGLAAALVAASPVSAATTLSTTGIVTDAFTANGNVNFDDASADTILIGQNLATPDTVTIAGDVSISDAQWGITAAGAGTLASLNGLTLTANADGFSIAGGTTPRTLAVTGGDITLTASGATNVALPTTGTLATLAGSETLTNKTLTSPTINGGSLTGLTAISLADGASHVLSITSGVLSANGSLQISAPLSTTMSLGGNLQTASAFATSGAFPVTLTATGLTGVTLPTSGTLATLAGTETLANKTLTSPKIASVLDANGNVILAMSPVASAVNSVSVSNANAGFPVTVQAVGTDTDVSMFLLPKGNGEIIVSNGVTNADQLAIKAQVAVTDAGNKGTLTSANLSGTRTWTLPDASGNIVTIAGTLAVASGKTLTANNTLTFTGTDGTSFSLPSANDTLVGAAATQTLTNKTLTAPRISGIKDLNGNDILLLNATAGAVNGFEMFNSPTGLGPTLMVVGAAANADMRLQAKGTGGFLFYDTAATGDLLKLQPQTGGAATFQGTLTSADLSGNQTWTLPNASGTVALLSDIAASGVTGTGSNGGVTFWTGASALSNDSANFFWDNTLKALGIGTNNPTTALAVADNNGATSNSSTLLTLTHNTTGTAANGIGAGVMLQAENGAGTPVDIAQIAAVLDDVTAGAESSTLKFFTKATGSALSPQLFVSSTGAYTPGTFAVLGSLSIGDATSDTMTFNAATASIADKLNFDAGTLIVDATNNRVGMGTSAPQAALHVQTGVSTAMSANLNPAGASSVIVAHQNGPQIDEFVVAGSTAVHRAILKGVRANGTLGAPTTAASGDHTFTVEGAAYDGANVNATAAVDFIIDGTVNSNVVPQRIAFMTSASNEAALAERMTVSPSGFVGVGDTSPAALFTVGNGDPFQIDASGNVATTGAVTIGSGGTSITKHFSVAQAVAGGASVNAQSCATIGGVTALGVAAGDTVIATPTAVSGGIETMSLSWNAYVSGPDSVSIRACNPTSGVETTVAQNWRVDVWKH